MKITRLRCEYRDLDSAIPPLGIGEACPRFSWQLESDRNGAGQTAYRLTVMKEKDVVWDSGVVETDSCFGIRCKVKLMELTAYRWQVAVRDECGQWHQSETADFETGFFSLESWPTAFLTCKGANGKPEAPQPNHVRKSFHLFPDKEMKSARLYTASTTGAYASVEGPMRNLTFANNQYLTWLNGNYVTDELQNPGQISEKKWRALYRTYDVTDMLHSGENVLGCVFVSMGFSACLYIHYTDGSMQLVGCEDMVRNHQGPYTLWDEGVEDQAGKRESYDATKEFTGWNLPGFDAKDWLPALTTDVVSCLSEQTVVTKVCAALNPCSIDRREAGRYIVDFGENINGNLRLTIRGSKRGTKITIRHSEVLSEDGELNPFSTINFARGEKDAQTDTYIARGSKTEVYMPRFAMHGFRYAEITGPETLEVQDVEANIIHSPVGLKGAFSCSASLINNIDQISRRTQRNNIVSVPTDCPHRERHGWLGDALLVCESECLNYDMTAFLENWLKIIHDDLPQSGVVQYISPFHSRFLHEQIDIPWGMACIAVPWFVYMESGDMTILKENFPVMKSWLRCIAGICNEERIPQNGIKWNDWLARQQMDEEYLGALYYYYGLCVAARIGDIIGETTEFKQLAEEVRASVNHRWYHDGHYSQDLQSDNAHGIYFGAVPEEDAEILTDQLAASLEKSVVMDAGALGIWAMIPALAQYGHNDTVWRLANLTCNGSWGGWITHRNATTAFERMYYHDKDNSIEDLSYDHPFLMGSINAWFYRELVGIKQICAGYRKFQIAPYIPDDLEFAEAELETPYGIIRFKWYKEGEKIIYNLHVPCSTEALVFPPGDCYEPTGADPDRVYKNGKLWLQSGNYVLEFDKLSLPLIKG